jgi:hypothetical protein
LKYEETPILRSKLIGSPSYISEGFAALKASQLSVFVELYCLYRRAKPDAMVESSAHKMTLYQGHIAHSLAA